MLLSFLLKWQQSFFHPSECFPGKVAADCPEDVKAAERRRFGGGPSKHGC